MKKETKQLVQILADKGVPWTYTRKEHIKITCPDGFVVITAATPSDNRAIKNTVALLRRHGVDV